MNLDSIKNKKMDFVNLEGTRINDIFEMDDFTNLTDFERTCFSLEIILRKWNIQNFENSKFDKNNLEKLEWNEKSEKFLFKNKNLVIKYYDPKIISNHKTMKKSDTTDYSNMLINRLYTNVPQFVNEFGIFQWILIHPESENNIISNKDDLNLLMSCLECCDIYCNIPFIIQFKNSYFGFQKDKLSKYEFKSCYFKTISTNFESIFNILDIFSTHLKCDTIKECDILHYCEFEYSYNLTKNKKHKITFSDLFEKSPIINKLFEILKYNDNLKEINNYIQKFKLFIQFDEPYSNKIVECLDSQKDILSMNDSFSKWFFYTKFRNDGSCFLTNIIKQCLILLKDTENFNISIQDILSNVNKKTSKNFFTNSFFFPDNIKLLSNESIDLSFQTITVGEIKNFQLNSKNIIKNIFSLVKKSVFNFNKSEFHDEDYLFIKTNLDKSKSTPSYCIVELISLTISIILHKEKHGIIFSCILWNEFLNNLQNYFERNKNIPGIPKKGYPIFSHSTLQQNIEFLQCCIRSNKKWLSLNDDQKNCGRKCKSKLTLYYYPEEYIYIPILQDIIPQTEEMFHNEINNLIERNCEERNIKQLTFLESDMSAFKAANPKCSFEDFIRWHSPNDWIYNNDKKLFEFSVRMLGNDNIWKKKWDECIPLSAYNQKKHFNENEEWKKSLEKIKNITLGEMISLIFPSSCKGMIQSLFNNFLIFSPTIKTKFKKLSIDFYQYTYESNIDVFQNVLKEFSYIENYIEKSFILKSYFLNGGNNISNIEHFLMDMADNCTIKIENDKRYEIKNLIKTTIIDKNDNFIFNKQNESSKCDVFCYNDSRIYVSYSKDGTRISSKMPILYNNIQTN